jgi:hypothetical protein
MSSKFSSFSQLELRRIAPMTEASHRTSLSVRTLKRRYPDKVRKISPRREGMQVADILEIAEGGEAADT